MQTPDAETDEKFHDLAQQNRDPAAFAEHRATWIARRVDEKIRDAEFIHYAIGKILADDEVCDDFCEAVVACVTRTGNDWDGASDIARLIERVAISHCAELFRRNYE